MLDQPYTYFVTDVMAVIDVITIIFVDGNFFCFFFVFLDLGWILVGFRLSPLQPEINQNTTLELCQVFNLKTTLVEFRLDLGCPHYNLKSTKIQRWNCVRFST